MGVSHLGSTMNQTWKRRLWSTTTSTSYTGHVSSSGSEPLSREQVSYDDGLSEIEQASSIGGGATDIQAQLAAAAAPLEYQATLETKFASYDNYCSLFHYILNSEGPVDLEVPNVRDCPSPLPTQH